MRFLVGWAKAPLRRAHVQRIWQTRGHASLCPPYGSFTPRFTKVKRDGCDNVALFAHRALQGNLMAKPLPKSVAPPVDLACADAGMSQQITRWLSHLRAERRLSPKTSEAYERDVRQFLTFLAEHWGSLVTLPRFAALETSDVRAFMAARRGDDIGSRSLMRALAGLRSFGRFLEREGQGNVGALSSIRAPQCSARNMRNCLTSRE